MLYYNYTYIITGPKVVLFPKELSHYGLDLNLLAKVYYQVKFAKKGPISWKLKGIPEIGFYENLCNFLKHWPETCSASKVELGKFYIAIDKSLQEKKMRPDNAYRFVETLVTSSLPRNTVVNYNIEKGTVKVLESDLKQCNEQIQKLTEDFAAMKLQLEDTKKELDSTQHTLENAINEVKRNNLKMRQKNACKMEEFCEHTIADSLSLDEEIAVIKAENVELSKTLSSIQKELSTFITDAVSIAVDSDSNFIIETKTGGRQYSTGIRKLYYTLLADQVPPAKIHNIIKSTLKCFFPLVNVKKLALPKERCAGYMRTDELSTISTVHKAIMVHDNIEHDKPLHLNMDGTTLNQKKLGGTAINNMVLSVNVLSDGTAETAIQDVSKELEKLRKIATALNLTYANSINWTIFSSMTSDSASAQKRCTKLMREYQDSDREKFGQAGPEAIDVVENFCAMHLGCNLRKAFISETNVVCTGEFREYHSVDVFVHEFCKLFGRYGVPEYAYGATKFLDFLNIMSEETSLTAEIASYYKSCANVVLDRQIGSRYFVTAANAGKILYLKEAAVEFLKYTGRENGNKLEKDVAMKLQDCNELVALKADALMFFHVYADLVTLAKSTELEKSAFDMNTHYFELQLFLQELEKNPEIIMNQHHQVYTSEERLYGDEKVNHRCHVKSKCIHNHLFVCDEWDQTLLYPIIANGAAAMKSKLCSYAQNHLPGGIYWDPEHKVKRVLAELNPSNDLCESILGLNDYLNNAIPNMHQITRSNLVQLKKNETIKWLQKLPESQQGKIIDLATASRREACVSRKEDDAMVLKLRRDNMIQAHNRLQALKNKERTEKHKLLKEHLITSSEELYQAMANIDAEISATTKRKTKKLSLLKVQVKIRKKLLKQNIRIVFTHSGKQRPLNEIAQELASFIGSTSASLKIIDPFTLLGKRVHHKFELEDTHLEKWYSGMVVDYDPVTKLHTIKYDGEEDHCQFDVTVDYILGDLVVIDN